VLFNNGIVLCMASFRRTMKLCPQSIVNRQLILAHSFIIFIETETSLFSRCLPGDSSLTTRMIGTTRKLCAV
jgi:hypothetical protein